MDVLFEATIASNNLPDIIKNIKVLANISERDIVTKKLNDTDSQISFKINDITVPTFQGTMTFLQKKSIACSFDA